MNLYIKHMVSPRCKMVVQEELQNLGIRYTAVSIGEVRLPEAITQKQNEHLRKNLLVSGLDLLDNKRTILIEKIKNVITEMIHYSKELPKMNYSDYISEKLNLNYTYLSNIFSEVNGIPIQQFIIIHKIERVKELLLYAEFNLTQIANELHYSSVAHLSKQFKKVTGLTPSFYKELKKKNRWSLENL